LRRADELMESPASPNPDIVFLRRVFPSANSVLIKGEKPVLIDTGYGSDFEDTAALIQSHGVRPESITKIVNTHYHSDHVGGNYGFQTRFGTPIAAHVWDAEMVNDRDPDVCGATWLDQPVEPYTVSESLEEGDVIDAGEVQLRVVHTPGHTIGHISLLDESSGSLICGDAVHADDVCWLNPFQEGALPLERATESIRRLLRLEPEWSCSGHGPSTGDPQGAFERALFRYDKWRNQPKGMAWHACKRIFSYRLMIAGGIDRFEVDNYLMKRAWYRSYCTDVFRTDPAVFIPEFMDEMIRSKAAKWDGDTLVAGAPYTVPAPDWQTGPGHVNDWPIA
jgi:glyoxylase-like metal-dependent hydrolase (beta-lactamase superfamily II)